MTVDLAHLVSDWDREFESKLPANATMDARRPYNRILEPLYTVMRLRFQPYQNDSMPLFLEKLAAWVAQFPSGDQPIAFLLASRIVFVTQHQFESLQRRLFRAHIQRHLLNSIIMRRSLRAHDYIEARHFLDEEMDATLFVPNSDSSHLNSFVHVNAEAFRDREARSLVGPEVTFWTYPTLRAAAASADISAACLTFEQKVLASDRHVVGKRRLVVLEDFSGTGSDLLGVVDALAASSLPFDEVVIAPAIATQHALDSLQARIRQLAKPGRYVTMAAQVLPHSLRCFDGPGTSYLDTGAPIPNLSAEVKRLSAEAYSRHFASLTPPLPPVYQHGYGPLALAFVLFANCPDNSLPMIWKGCQTWSPLFRRVSRHL